MSKIKIGILAGSGLDDPDILLDRKEKHVKTPFGKPSDALIEGNIGGVPCVLLARHGRKHTVYPSTVPYRANIWALKEAGCTHIIASTACGGLQEYTKPGIFVVLDQFIDRTSKRDVTFFDGSPGHPCQGVLHMPMGTPFCERTRQILIESCKAEGVEFRPQGTVVTIEGPRFSTKAESKMFRSWGGEVINMTSVPEVGLAREAGLSYASVAMVTDYDCWREEGEMVTVDKVLETFKTNADKVKKVILRAIPLVAKQDWADTIAENQKRVSENRQDSQH